MAYLKPNISIRESKLQPKQSAILFVDVQNYGFHPDGKMFKECEDSYAYYEERQPQVKSNLQILQTLFRKAGIEVLYTVMESLTLDGRDRSLDYKISGFHLPKGCWDSKVIDEIQPIKDEIVIPKTSSSVFISTNIHYLLGNLNVKQLVIVGALTDQCISSAVRDACDLGYLVTVVTDACISLSKENHDSSLRNIKGYCRQRTTEQLIEEMNN